MKYKQHLTILGKYGIFGIIGSTVFTIFGISSYADVILTKITSLKKIVHF